MSRYLRLLTVLLLLVVGLVACRGDEEGGEIATATPATLPTAAPIVVVTNTSAPPPTSTPVSYTHLHLAGDLRPGRAEDAPPPAVATARCV